MIPVRLQLTNFKSFKDDEIIFEGLDAVAISGHNGAGKSSIIDAMVWALWGETSVDTVDEIIHQNENNCEVEFDFLVNNEKYRIIRKRNRGKQSSLNFLKLTGETSVSLTEATLKDTNNTIEKLIHLSSETFYNSAYIRQGHSDEFTSQTTANQKEILSNILDLNFYSLCAQNAKDKSKISATNVKLISENIRIAKEEIEKIADYKSKLTIISSDLNNANKENEVLSLQKIKISNELAVLTKGQETYNYIKNQLLSYKNRINETLNSIQQSKNRISKLQSIIDQKDEIENGYNQLENLDKIIDDLQEKKDKFTAIKEEANGLAKAINAIKHQLEKQVLDIQSEITQEKIKLAKLEGFKKRLTELENNKNQYSDTDKYVKTKEEKVIELRNKITIIDIEKTNIQSNINANNEKLKLLSHTNCDETKCPLCNNELKPEQLSLVIQKLNYELEEYNKQLQESDNKKNNIENEINITNSDISNLKENAKIQLELIQKDIESIKLSIFESEQANNKILKLEKEVSEITQSLETNSFEIENRNKYLDLTEQLTKIGYDTTIFNNCKEKRKELSKYHTLIIELKNSIEQISIENANYETFNKTLEKLNCSLKETETTLNGIAYDEKAVKTKTAELNTIENKIKIQTNLISDLMKKNAECTAKIISLEETKCKIENQEEILNKQIEENTIYNELTTIFGDKGIKALLIDAALPQLSNEANKLLNKMSNGSMTIDFSSQKENKNGSKAETIKVNIWHNGIDRDYKSYSGGEKFRIDLSIRIAMARLLTNRIGAPMQTLIIDEGFGTQDEDGIESVVNAINSIKNEFKMIIVITHIDALKDAFENKIIVSKTDGASHTTINRI